MKNPMKWHIAYNRRHKALCGFPVFTGNKFHAVAKMPLFYGIHVRLGTFTLPRLSQEKRHQEWCPECREVYAEEVESRLLMEQLA